MKSLLILIYFGLIFVGQTFAINTVADGFRINNGATTNIDAHSICRDVTNNSGFDQFVSTRTPQEWSSFLAGLPSGFTALACAGGTTICPSLSTPAGTNLLFLEPGLEHTGTSTTTLIRDTTQFATGTSSILFDNTGMTGSVYIPKMNSALGNNLRTSFYLRLNSFPSTGDFLPLFNWENSKGRIGIAIGEVGDIRLYVENMPTFGSASTPYKAGSSRLQLYTWYRITVAAAVPSSYVWNATVYVDGTLDMSASDSELTMRSSSADYFVFGVSSLYLNSQSTEHPYKMWMDDIYVDNAISLSEIGEIHVTSKKPTALGTNTFGTAWGASPVNRWSNVNEIPLSTLNGWETSGTSETETYLLETRNQGTVDLTNQKIIGHGAWSSLSTGTSGTSPTTYIVRNGIDNLVNVISSTSSIFASYELNASYPAGDFGVKKTAGSKSIRLFETGGLIAYAPLCSPPQAKLAFFVNPPSSVAQGAPFSTGFQIQDATGFSIDSSGSYVTVSAYTDSNCTVPVSSSNFYLNTNQYAVSGSVSFPNLTFAQAGTYYLKATSGEALPSDCSNMITVTTVASTSPVISYFTGFETGNANELMLSQTNCTGAPPLTTITGGSGTYGAGTNVSAFATVYDRIGNANNTFSVRFKADGNPIQMDLTTCSSTPVTAMRLTVASNAILSQNSTANNRAAIGGAIPQDGNYHQVSFSFDPAANGLIKVWLDGALVIYTSHSLAVSVAAIKIAGLGYDDFIVSPGSVKLPDIRVIARQGTTGTPTYNAFTKTSSATIDAVWSNTPFNNTTNASSAGSGAAQTMLISSFSPSISASSIIQSCKSAFIGMRGSGGGCSVSHRTRIGGVDTTTLIGALTTADAYYESPSFVPTLTNLNSMEAGVVRAACTTQTTTIEDLWVMCAYVP